MSDQSDFCTATYIFNNTIGPNIPSHCVDIKEGTNGGIVRGNIFNSTRDNGDVYSDSSLSVKGNSFKVEDNISENSRLFGFEVTQIYEKHAMAWDNEVRNNKCKHIQLNGLCAVNQAPDSGNVFVNNVII